MNELSTIPEKVAEALKGGSILRLSGVVPGSRIFVGSGENHYFNEVVDTEEVEIHLPIRGERVDVRIRNAGSDVYFLSWEQNISCDADIKVNQMMDRFY